MTHVGHIVCVAVVLLGIPLRAAVLCGLFWASLMVMATLSR